MNIVIAVLLLILVLTAAGRKTKKPYDPEWVDRLEELDAVIDDE